MPISNGPGLLVLPAGAALELHAVRAKEPTNKAAKISVEGLAIVCLPSTGLPLPFCLLTFHAVAVSYGSCDSRHQGHVEGPVRLHA